MTLLDKEILLAGGKMTWNPLNFTELTVGNIINRILFSERFTEVEIAFLQKVSTHRRRKRNSSGSNTL